MDQRERERERRARLTTVFDEESPDADRDEPADARRSDRDDELRREVPPHHG